EQGIGCDRGAHFHDFNELGSDGLAGLETQQLAYALYRGIRILLGVLRQQLGRYQLPIGPARHDVGQSAAAIHPVLPATSVCAGCTRCTVHSEDAARAAWSYKPDSRRRRSATSDRASLLASSPSTPGNRQRSRTSRKRSSNALLLSVLR